MDSKVLVVDASLTPLSLVQWRKAFNYVYLDKGFFLFEDAVVQLKRIVPHRRSYIPFSRRAVFNRDQSTCQYCGKSLKRDERTIDHVIPKAHGGQTSFTNCVTACFHCNNEKSDKLPHQYHRPLLKNPRVPTFEESGDSTHSILLNKFNSWVAQFVS